MRIIRKRGQSVTEYAIVFSVVAAAMIGMQIYLKRGLQAKQRDATEFFTGVTGDSLNVGTNVTTLSQYEPYYTNQDYNVTQSSSSSEAVGAGGVVDRNVAFETTNRTGTQASETGLGTDDSWQ